MDWNIVVAGLVIIGIVYFFIRRQRQPAETPPEDPDALKLDNVDIGGVVKISTSREPFVDYNLVITGKHRYLAGNSEWFEITGDNGSEKVSLEYERDGDLSISLQLQQLSLEDLSINRESLQRFDNDASGSIIYEGEMFQYKDSGEAVFYRNCGLDKAEKVHYWDFAANEGKYLISCEMWSDGSIDVYYSISIPESSIEVLSLTES